ncbi:MAG: hypothetical protein H6850_03420 [Alphaproteobacteria bacterium]|nr:MAG: hypothetical protein H6850_03420 [Alphaproteobacteria bacterium]
MFLPLYLYTTTPRFEPVAVKKLHTSDTFSDSGDSDHSVSPRNIELDPMIFDVRSLDVRIICYATITNGWGRRAHRERHAAQSLLVQTKNAEEALKDNKALQSNISFNVTPLRRKVFLNLTHNPNNIPPEFHTVIEQLKARGLIIFAAKNHIPDVLKHLEQMLSEDAFE